MELVNQYHFAAATFVARVFLGFLFFFQGYDAVFRIKISNVIKTFKADFSQHGIPSFAITAASWYTTCTELICGALLVVGFMEHICLLLLGINILIAATGFGIAKPMWDTRHVLPRLALLLLLLFIPPELQKWTIDFLIFKP